MIEGKASAYQALPGIDPPTYYENSYITTIKKFYNNGPRLFKITKEVL
jgi:hypothetical protein